MAHPPPPLTAPPPCHTLAAPASGADLARLCADLRQLWHQQTHAQAGRWRVARVDLHLGRAWATVAQQALAREQAAAAAARDASPTTAPAELCRLARQWQGAGLLRLTVCAEPALPGAALHLHWVPWAAASSVPEPSPLSTVSTVSPSQAAASGVSSPPTASTGVAMKFSIPGWAKSAPAPIAAARDSRPPTEPGLAPDRVPAPPAPARQQLPQVLGEMAQQIVNHEVRDLLDTVDCRYELLVLTFWISTANQPALRNLMDVNQKNPQVARDIVVSGFTKNSPEAARLLNTVRLKLEFKPGDNLPRGVSEVLLVCGRETVVLPFSYTGQIQLQSDQPQAAAVSAAASASLSPRAGGRAPTLLAPLPGQPLSAVTPAALPAGGGVLVLWAQWPGQTTPQSWRFEAAALAATPAAPVLVGVNPDSGVPVADLPYISGEHLRLLPPAQAGDPWQVVDVSRNGSALFNPHSPAGEAALLHGQPQALPPSGALRLGPLPDSPLLHFVQPATVAPAQAAPAVVPMRPKRRVTEMTAVPPTSATSGV